MKGAIKHLAHMIHDAEPNGEFAFELWDGETVMFGDHPKVVLRIKTQESAGRILGDGFCGFGEAYMAGEIEVEGDLQELLRLGISARYDQMQPSSWEKVRFLASRIKCRNSAKRAPLNISHHYDLGNDFYALCLDETMTYSCAYFKDGEEPLEEAQRNKYELIARKLMLKPGERLLDVGCGWGGMLIHAAQKYGVKGLGNTLSREQYEYANRKIKELGLEGQVEVVLEDYRSLTGKFDKFVSIGMFEHVGKQYIPEFMRKVSELLNRGSLGLLHTIGKETASPADSWILRYIFPGGYLPNLPEIAHHLGAHGLSVLDVENLRMHYARTLDRWAKNFENNIEKVREMFDDPFVRMWRLYLNASSVGFKCAESRLYQILFSNGLNNHLPATREHFYAAPGA